MFPIDPGLINWRGPNWATAGFFLLCLISVQIPFQKVYFGIVPHEVVLVLVTTYLAMIFNRTVDFYARRINVFRPQTVLEAKRANEQIKSLASAINALSGGSVIAVAVRQLTQAQPDYSLIVATTAAGVWAHSLGRSLLGMLKDENVMVGEANSN